MQGLTGQIISYYILLSIFFCACMDPSIQSRCADDAHKYRGNDARCLIYQPDPMNSLYGVQPVTEREKKPVQYSSKSQIPLEELSRYLNRYDQGELSMDELRDVLTLLQPSDQDMMSANESPWRINQVIALTPQSDPYIFRHGIHVGHTGTLLLLSLIHI